MTFHDVLFPLDIALKSAGGPERRTDVVALGSGREERNARWANSRRRYNAGYGVKSLDDISAVIAFFEERRGKLHAFRFKDFTDYKSCAPSQVVSATDQLIGTGDGTTTSFALVKTHGQARPYPRAIIAPVAGTVVVAVNGTATTAFTITDGLVTCASAPSVGATITAGFEFDVPVRFDTDDIKINLSHFAAGEIPDIPLVEVRA